MKLWKSTEGGVTLSPRTGRPKADNPRRNDIKVRVNDETMQRLDAYCAKHGIKRAEAIRRGLDLLLKEK